MTTQRGLTVLTGAHLVPHEDGAQALWLAPTGDDVVFALHGDADDSARVRDALRSLVATPAQPCVFMLSYEACVALDPRLPRARHDPRLGPDVLVRRCRATAPQQVASAPAPRWHVAAGAHDAHVERVRAAREHLLDGVIYQANLAHRLTVAPATHDEGLGFFLAACAQRAPPCAAFVDVPSWGSLVSLSPERFIVATCPPAPGAGEARAYPIKGTRPRGATPLDDARLAAELLASAKDTAEHVMIVDLLRNDLGKLAVAAGVTVERMLDVVSVKNVHHLESTVMARLRPDTTVIDLIAATAPGGSITGAPKSSAVEVIRALEAGPRGPYTGVLGVFDGTTLRSSLLIRTWLRADDGEGALHVGGGIVVDSEPEAEWRETLDKAAAFLG